MVVYIYQKLLVTVQGSCAKKVVHAVNLSLGTQITAMRSAKIIFVNKTPRTVSPIPLCVNSNRALDYCDDGLVSLLR